MAGTQNKRRNRIFHLAIVLALLAALLPLATGTTGDEASAGVAVPGSGAAQQSQNALYVDASTDGWADQRAGTKQELVQPKDNLAAAPNAANAAAAISNYAFTSANSVSLEDMSSGTTQLVGPNVDDTSSVPVNTGFDFYFMGVPSTHFSVNANGLLKLGAAAISTSWDNSTDFVSPLNNPKFAPFFDDLFVGTNGKVHYKVLGSAPNRKLVVEWLNIQLPRVGIGVPGGATFQVWLFESTGAIQIVYGTGMALSSAQGGYTIGMAAASTSFASVTSASDTVSYAVHNATQTNAIASGKAYLFTPPVPDAPTSLTFSNVQAAWMDLDWADSANEVAYAVYRSTDGVNYSFITTLAENTTSYTATELSPGTTYLWKIYAVSEGALSTSLSGSQATTPTGSVSSLASGGLWSAPSTWAGGVIPTGSDIVNIVNGATVTIDTAAFAYSITVSNGGSMQFEDTTARTLTVATDVTIDSGGTLQTATAGTVISHVLWIGGNLTNNGTLDLSTNGDTAGAEITFTGAAEKTFGGTGGTTDVRTVTVNKGTTSDSILELNPTSFTVQGVSTDVAGFLTLTNGTLEISGSFPMTNRVFTSPTYVIPATGGIWLNNPNFTVVGQAGGTTTANDGLFRVSQGVYNIGVGAADGMGGGASAVFLIEGGTVNASGRIDPQSAGVLYTQTGGTVNVAVVGNNRSNFGSFDIPSTAAFINISGGTINLINPSTGATKIDYRNGGFASLNTSMTGGTLVIGAAGAPAGSLYNVRGSLPNVTVNATQTMFLAAANRLLGTALINNGTITGSTQFGSLDGPTTYSGTGIYGTLAAPIGTIGTSTCFATTLNAPIVTTIVRLFCGDIINSNQITLGNGGTSTTIVQLGNPGSPGIGGTFDVSPIHNQGTGGESLAYTGVTGQRTTGFEVNPTRSLGLFSINNPGGVVIAGGDITLFKTGNVLSIGSVRVSTGPNVIYLSSGAGAVTRTTGYVDGNLRKSFAASGSKTFEVGTANGYSPVVVNMTAAGSFPVDFQAKAVQGPMPSFYYPTRALQRYWMLTASGVTADLTFNYLDPADIPATTNESNFTIFKYDGASLTMPGGTINTTANSATINGVTSFSDWSLAEPEAGYTPTPTPTNTLTPTNTPTPTYTATATATPNASCLCSLAVTGVSLSCNADGTVRWTANVNNRGTCSTYAGWQAELQSNLRGGGGFETVRTTTGYTLFPPGNTTVNIDGDYDFCYQFAPETKEMRVALKIDSGARSCKPQAKSEAIPPCNRTNICP